MAETTELLDCCLRVVELPAAAFRGSDVFEAAIAEVVEQAQQLAVRQSRYDDRKRDRG